MVISNALVIKLGGEDGLKIKSTPGIGTKFFFNINNSINILKSSFVSSASKKYSKNISVIKEITKEEEDANTLSSVKMKESKKDGKITFCDQNKLENHLHTIDS